MRATGGEASPSRVYTMWSGSGRHHHGPITSTQDIRNPAQLGNSAEFSGGSSCRTIDSARHFPPGPTGAVRGPRHWLASNR